MNRQELLRKAEELREVNDVESAVVKADWGFDGEDCLEIRSDGFSWAVRDLIVDGFIPAGEVKKDGFINTFRLRP